MYSGPTRETTSKPAGPASTYGAETPYRIAADVRSGSSRRGRLSLDGQPESRRKMVRVDRFEGRCWLDWWANSSTLLASTAMIADFAVLDGNHHIAVAVRLRLESAPITLVRGPIAPRPAHAKSMRPEDLATIERAILLGS